MVLLTVHIASQILDYTIGGICLVLFFSYRCGYRGASKRQCRHFRRRVGGRGSVALMAIALLMGAAFVGLPAGSGFVLPARRWHLREPR
ncbi:MAG: hypothetical protein ACJ0TD_10900 [Arenicellales bacterium]